MVHIHTDENVRARMREHWNVKEFASSSEGGMEGGGVLRVLTEIFVRSNPGELTLSEESDLGPGSRVTERLGAPMLSASVPLGSPTFWALGSS